MPLQDTVVTRRAVLGAGAAFGVTMLAACQPSNPSTAPTPLPTSGTVDLSVLVETNTLAWWQDVVELFNASSPFQINAEFNTIANADAKVQLSATLGAADAPDFSYTLIGNSVLGGLVKTGLVTDLTPYSDQYGWQSRFAPGLWESFKYGDTIPSIGYDTVPHTFIWYKKSVFERIGLEVPTDRIVSRSLMSDFVAAAAAAGLEPVSLGNRDIWPGSQTLSMTCQRMLSTEQLSGLQDAWHADSGVRWTDPDVVAALAQAQEMTTSDGWYVRAFNGLSNDDAQALLVNEGAAMLQQGYWFNSVVQSLDPGGVYDFFEFPVLNPSQPVRIINFSANGMVIPTRGKNPAVAAALYDFFISTKAQQVGLESYGRLGSLLGLADDPALTFPNQNLRDVVALVDVTDQNPFQMENDAPSEIAQDMMKMTQTLLAGDIEPKAYGETLQTMIDDNIQANG